MLVLFPKLTEMGIKSFWDVVDVGKKASLSMRDWVMQMPAVGSGISAACFAHV